MKKYTVIFNESGQRTFVRVEANSWQEAIGKATQIRIAQLVEWNHIVAVDEQQEQTGTIIIKLPSVGYKLELSTTATVLNGWGHL